MASGTTTPPVQKLFSLKGNETALEELSTKFPLFAYPEYNLILFEGSYQELLIVTKQLN